MTCFIANPNACRSYAKCHGWQETLAHFFLKTRRPPSITHVISSSASMGALSTYLKDPSVDSGRESSTDTHIDHSNLHIPFVPPQVFEISSSPDDPNKEKCVRQLDLSPIIDTKISRTPRHSSLSSSSLTTTMSISIDGRDTTPEFLRRNSEEFPSNTIESINTPFSREDLLSTDDFTSISSTNALPTTPLTSIYNDERNNEQYRSLEPHFRYSVRINQTRFFFISGVISNEDEGLLEELCEALILTIVMVLWKGVAGSDEESWMVRQSI